jgi:hypothetical protein
LGEAGQATKAVESHQLFLAWTHEPDIQDDVHGGRELQSHSMARVLHSARVADHGGCMKEPDQDPRKYAKMILVLMVMTIIYFCLVAMVPRHSIYCCQGGNHHGGSKD